MGFGARPFPHTIHMGVGGAASSFNVSAMSWPRPVESSRRLQLDFESKSAIQAKSPAISPFEHVNRVIWMLPLSLGGENSLSAVVCQTHRLHINTLQCQGWREAKAVWSDTILRAGYNVTHRPP